VSKLHIIVIVSSRSDERRSQHVDDSKSWYLKCDNRGSIDCNLWYTHIIYGFIISLNLKNIYLFFPFLNAI